MLSTLPADYKIFINWAWTQLEPYYQDLTTRPLDTESVAEWLGDWTRLGKTVSEMSARLHLATAQNTADTEAEQRYLTFIGEVQPKVEEAEQRLKQKLLDSGLQPAGLRCRCATCAPKPNCFVKRICR